MARFAIRRLLQMVLVLFAVSVLVFLVFNAASLAVLGLIVPASKTGDLDEVLAYYKEYADARRAKLDYEIRPGRTVTCVGVSFHSVRVSDTTADEPVTSTPSTRTDTDSTPTGPFIVI